jgi:hypothetical protein
MSRPTKEEFVSSLHAKGYVPDGKGGFTKNWKIKTLGVSKLTGQDVLVRVDEEIGAAIASMPVSLPKQLSTDYRANSAPCIIAIDPGSSGGIAWTQPGKGAQAIKMPEDMIEAGAKIGEIIKGLGENVTAYVERVAGFFPKSKEPDDGKQFRLEGQSHLMFNFGKNYGIVLGALSAIGCKVEIVESKAWQKPLFMSKKGKARDTWKRELRDRAQRIYPGLKVTLSTADALLMLHYAQLKQAPSSSREEAKKEEAV